MKKFAIPVVTLVCLLAGTTTAFAGEWKSDNVGWWYQKDDGSYDTNSWQWIDGDKDGVAECYYFDGNGYMAADILVDGYQVNEEGAWVVDGVVQTRGADASGTQAADRDSIVDITFQMGSSGSEEYAVITALNLEGETVWQYTTPKYISAELDRVTDIGRVGDRYFLVQGGAVVALDALTGNVLWENSDFLGSGDAAIGENAIYLCGFYGPDFYAVTFEGETLCRIASFSDEYYWAYQIDLEDGVALVSMDGAPESEERPVRFAVDLDTWEYRLVR